MSWKKFYLRNPITEADSYCVNSYGALGSINSEMQGKNGRRAYENVWLEYNEIIEILNLKTKQERYTLCDKLFKEKFPQSKEKQKELSKDEQSELEKLFP